MAGAADADSHRIISAYTEAAGKAGRLGDHASEIRMLQYVITTLPEQLDTVFCLAEALFDHDQASRSVATFTEAFEELQDMVVQIECMKRQLTAQDNPADHPSTIFPNTWRASLLPEHMLSSYMSQKMHKATNIVEQCIRGRNDLAPEIALLNRMTNMIELSVQSSPGPTSDACTRVYYVKGEAHRKFHQPALAEDCFMTADGYCMVSNNLSFRLRTVSTVGTCCNCTHLEFCFYY